MRAGRSTSRRQTVALGEPAQPATPRLSGFGGIVVGTATASSSSHSGHPATEESPLNALLQRSNVPRLSIPCAINRGTQSVHLSGQRTPGRKLTTDLSNSLATAEADQANDPEENPLNALLARSNVTRLSVPCVLNRRTQSRHLSGQRTPGRKLTVDLSHTLATAEADPETDPEVLPPARHSARASTGAQHLRYDREAFRQMDMLVFFCSGTLWDAVVVGDSRSLLELERLTVEKVNGLINSGKRALFVTNSPCDSRQGFAQKMLKRSLRPCGAGSPEAPEQCVVSVGHTCALYCQARGIRRPLVITTSAVGLLEDLQAAGITDCVATCDKDGRLSEAYRRAATEKNVEELLAKAPGVDAVVLGHCGELTALAVAVVARLLALGPKSQGGATAVPLLVCCSAPTRRKVAAVSASAACSVVQASFEPDAVGVDMRATSEAACEAMLRPVPQGGYGLDFGKSVLVSSSLEPDIGFANRTGMHSLLLLGSAAVRLDLAMERRETMLPSWTLSSLADL